MIVVDTSALVAMLFNEKEARSFARVIDTEGRVLIAAPTAFEFRLVTIRKLGTDAVAEADHLLDELELDVMPWTPEHVLLAQDALVRFGGRPGRLNFGDYLTYALAKSLDAPLLYKGDDFSHTDIRSAL